MYVCMYVCMYVSRTLRCRLGVTPEFFSLYVRAEGGAASEASKPPEARGGGCRVDLVKSASKGGGKCWIRIKRYKKSTIIVAKATTRRKIEPSTKCVCLLQRTHTTPTTQKSVCVEIKNSLQPCYSCSNLARAIYIHISIRVDRATVQLYSCTLLNLDFGFCSSHIICKQRPLPRRPFERSRHRRHNRACNPLTNCRLTILC